MVRFRSRQVLRSDVARCGTGDGPKVAGGGKSTSDGAQYKGLEKQQSIDQSSYPPDYTADVDIFQVGDISMRSGSVRLFPGTEFD